MDAFCHQSFQSYVNLQKQTINKEVKTIEKTQLINTTPERQVFGAPSLMSLFRSVGVFDEPKAMVDSRFLQNKVNKVNMQIHHITFLILLSNNITNKYSSLVLVLVVL